MNELINEFWEWAQISPEEYAKDGIDLESDKVEFYYPKLGELLKYEETIIHQSEISDAEMDDLLIIMALDNETENVLHRAIDDLMEKHVERFAELGSTHFQPNVRWQTTEFIFHRKPCKIKSYLSKLKDDEHSYVRKRAKNVISYLGLGL